MHVILLQYSKKRLVATELNGPQLVIVPMLLVDIFDIAMLVAVLKFVHIGARLANIDS